MLICTWVDLLHTLFTKELKGFIKFLHYYWIVWSFSKFEHFSYYSFDFCWFVWKVTKTIVFALSIYVQCIEQKYSKLIVFIYGFFNNNTILNSNKEQPLSISWWNSCYLAVAVGSVASSVELWLIVYRSHTCYQLRAAVNLSLGSR